ncbi:MAG: SET domain-containing protein [Chlamydiota bacterium]
MFSFFKSKKIQLPSLRRAQGSILIEKEGIERCVSIEEFENLTGTKFIPHLDFEDSGVFSDLSRRGLKLHKKGELTQEQLWLGSYFQKELLFPEVPSVVIRWIDSTIKWGVFANRDFKKMEFIAEYTGKVRQRKRADSKNAYCFEYIAAAGFKTPYLIDALEQGGISRYLNHSEAPNLKSSLATYQNISHIVLYAGKFIPKGTQLCYDYGPDYWAHRTAPLNL